MPVKEIRLLNIFLIFLLAIVVCCQYKQDDTTLNNGEYFTWNSSDLESNWQQKGIRFNNFEITSHLGKDYFHLKQGVIFQNSISKTLSLSKGRYYIIESSVMIDDGSNFEFGIKVNQNGLEIGHHFINSSKDGKQISLGMKIKAIGAQAEIILGFSNRGFASALIENVTIKETTEIPANFNNQSANILATEIGLANFDSINYHTNILLLVNYINSILIVPLNQYYSYTGSEPKENFLIGLDSIRMFEARRMERILGQGYITKYMDEPILNSADNYCVKVSHSSFNIFNVFNIPTRQIHFTNKEGNAVHQLFEYWHPYQGKWILVDPYYGNCYVDQYGSLLGFDEIKKYASDSLLDSTFVKHEKINRFYYNLEELSIGWNDKMFRGKSLATDKLSWVY